MNRQLLIKNLDGFPQISNILFLTNRDDNLKK